MALLTTKTGEPVAPTTEEKVIAQEAHRALISRGELANVAEMKRVDPLRRTLRRTGQC